MKADAAKKKRRRNLSSFTILLIILVALAVITVAMSLSGTEGIEGATISGVATAPVKGFMDALPVGLFVLVLGGFLGVVTETGALDAGIAALVRKLKGNELVLIPILMFVFSIGGTTYGMCEETVPFYLLLAATMVAAGFDTVVAAATVLLGAGCGVLGSTVNPFAIGAAVDALSSTGLEVNQGIIIGLGVVLWLSTLFVSILFVMRYARKVKADKGSTILSLQEREDMVREFGTSRVDGAPAVPAVPAVGASAGDSSADLASDVSGVSDPAVPAMTGRQKATLLVFAFTFAVMIVGFIPWNDFGVSFFDAGSEYAVVEDVVSDEEIESVYDEATGSELVLDDNATGVATSEETVRESWSAILTGYSLGHWYFNEASTWFLLMAIVLGFVGGLSESRFVRSFVNGASDMISVVLVIALARSITVLMGETGLDVWILEHAAHALEGLSAVVFAPLSFLLYVVLSFLVPSSSGMATVSIPIMAPLAQHLGFSVEAMIMVFSAGNGLVNMFTPTCAAIMGGLALAKVEWSTWVRFAAPLLVALALICVVILTVAMMVLPG